jgi:8-amino-7-oxononanoate synthase
LVISTGYQTAQAIIPTLAQRGEYVISDKDNHASIASANVMATGLGARVLRYRPGDMGNLEEILASIPHEAPKLIVTDGVFSTTGTIADLTGITRLARRHNARVMCDDAHAVGVLGPGGRGTAAHFGLTAEVDVTMGTFSKSLASLGGFVAAPRAVIDYIRHMAPSLIFSASPTPASAAAALAALDIIEAEPERIARLHANAARVRQGLETLGFRVFGHADTGIVSVLIGDEYTTILFTKELFDAGIFVNPFVKPGVPEGREMIRTSYMSTHEDEHLDRVIEAFAVIGKRLGLIGGGAMAPAV